VIQFVRDADLCYETKLLRAVAENPDKISWITDRDLKGLLLGALEDLDLCSLLGGAAQRPIRHDQNLLRILSRLDFEDEIPPEVYKAVVGIMVFIYRSSNLGEVK
jgi:hypothetical protein